MNIREAITSGGLSDLTLTITLPKFEWANISQGHFTDALLGRISHQVTVQMSEELSHLNSIEQQELLSLSGWRCTGVMRQRDSAACVYEYAKEVNGEVYTTYLPFESEGTSEYLF